MISNRAQREGFAPDDVAALGIDIGPTTGMCLGVWAGGDCELLACLAFECTGEMSLDMLRVMAGGMYGWPVPRAVQLEEFREGPRAQKLRGVSAPSMRAQAGRLCSWLTEHEIPVIQRPAAIVKPWATDKRLGTAELLAPTERFTDARDAARHMLFTSVQDCGVPDPLSARAGTGGAR